MKKSRICENLGGKIMIAQEQYIHQKRLNEIYGKRPELSSTTVNYDYLMRFSSRNPLKMTKSAFNQEMNHHLTLKHLIQRLNSPKSYADRLKDDHDFIAHPSLFFRNTQNNLNPKKSKKSKTTPKKNLNRKRMDKISNDMYSNDTLHQKPSSNKKKVQKTAKNQLQQIHSSPSVNSEMPHNGLTLEKVIKQLPRLQKFEQEDIEQFAEKLTQMIFKYNLNSMQDIEFLFECVENYLPDHYPEHFISSIEDMFRQIVTSLNIGQ